VLARAWIVLCMPRLRSIDHAALDDLLRGRERVVTHRELVEMGMGISTVCHRIRPTGPWQRLHPGVVLAHSGSPTFRERMLGGLAFAGDDALLTGACALRLYGVNAVRSVRRAHVLVPHRRHRQSRAELTVERTRHLPEPVVRSGLRLAPPARALVDACRAMERLDDVRELVAEVVQTGLCTVDELHEALVQAARQRTALPRRVLLEVGLGVWSAAEAKVREVFERHGIPQPRWNWALHTLDGTHVVTPDGWWELIGAALQIDSMAWHLSPARYKRTQQLQRALGLHDVPFLPVAPGDVFADEAGFVAEVRAFLRRYAEHQPTSDLVARPPSSGRARRSA
jgi:hypothetical protein